MHPLDFSNNSVGQWYLLDIWISSQSIILDLPIRINRVWYPKDAVKSSVSIVFPEYTHPSPCCLLIYATVCEQERLKSVCHG
jgi:hypothetical protein